MRLSNIWGMGRATDPTKREILTELNRHTFDVSTHHARRAAEQRKDHAE